MVETAHDARVPITLLTGFLGAGKTTMLNHLLTDPLSGRIAVIVNEFGAIGIDGDLITRRDEEMMELSNGCICCQSKDDLVGALYTLYKRKLGLEGSKISFDRIVIETTGLADPIPLAQLFFTDMNLSLTFRLDAIVTVVDLKHVIGQLKNAPEAEKQIAISDKLVLNKRDLVSDEQFKQALVLVRGLNPRSETVVTTNALLRPAELLDLGLFNPNDKEASIDQWLGHHHAPSSELGDLRPYGHADHEHDCQICREDHAHLANITSMSLYESRPLAYEELMRFLAELIEKYGDDLYRIKGLVRFTDQDRPVIVQGVQRVLSPLAYADRWPDDKPATRLVLIGKGLKRGTIERQFTECIAPERPVLDRALGSI